ncbi:Protein abhd8 [Halocaridina rubra]|uniref:acylglycerol lipase n=1 Tax=Halocaridina rubra TaxID=373956 RepID=A0AAN8XHL7_HALRR
MDSLHLHILSLRDEVVENWNMVWDCFTQALPKKHNSIGIATTDLGLDSDGRVWVEVGRPGLRLRVMHLHPANPAIAEAVSARLSGAEGSKLGENMISLSSEDDISLASLEDYWFNHWQGPYITADSNQNNVNLRLSRRSLRKSKRKFRCSICQKKLIGAERHHDELQEPPCFDGENVVAHVPSVKLETRTSNPKADETAAVSSDDECIKPAISEEALSRYSASDEQLARAYRVLDNELRTSFTLFSEEAVTQDVVDGVSMNVNDNSDSPDTALRLAPPPYSPRQSRSCPCSPKLAGRNHSPKSNTNSPKPRSRSERSKFSLSSSLMAIHRQASNTLRPDFLRFDSSKADAAGGSSSKNGSQHNSLKNESKQSRTSLESQQAQINESHLNVSHTGSLRGESAIQEASRTALHESHSLPALKLSRMSLTYKGGVIINAEKESLQNVTSDKAKLLTEGACALPSTPENDALLEPSASCSVFLPDVVPRSEITGSAFNGSMEEQPSTSTSGIFVPEKRGSYPYEMKEGVVNLGFDGHEESSDFCTLNETVHAKPSDVEKNSLTVDDKQPLESDIDIGKNNVQLSISNVHAISIGHSAQGQEVALSLDVPQVVSQERKQATCETGELTEASEPNTQPSQPSAGTPSLPRGISKEQHEANLAALDMEDTDPIPFDHMQEARQLVFWWQKPKPNDSEFCENHTECRVKQKPLLLFLHGMGGSSDQWRQQLWYFVCCGYEVVAPDLLGHGLSSAPRDPSQYTFAQMLDHVMLVFDLFVPQGRKCVVIGHGYGCSIAAALARGRSPSVRLVILASCGGPNPLVPNPPSKSILHSYLATFLSPFLACGCCSRDLLYAPRGKHFEASTLSGQAITPTPRYVLEYVAKGQDWPEGDVAFHRRITAPTLLLHGMKDDRVGLVEMCEMEKTIPRAFLEMITGSGHDIMTDTPLEVCHSIHRFIKRWHQQL